jgi:hypothetical protein
MPSSDRSDPRARYRAAVARQLAEQDLRRAVPAVLGAPRDDSARFDLAEALKLLGSGRAADAVGAGGLLSLCGGYLYVLHGDPVRPACHLVAAVEPGDVPGCCGCGEVADGQDLDDTGCGWMCPECIAREIPF